MSKLTKRIDGMPLCPERYILRQLDYHWGEANAISRTDLLEALNKYNRHVQIEDRDLRRRIAALREQGLPICSKGGLSGGYWLDGDEGVRQHIEREDGRAKKIFKRDHAMLRAAQTGKFNPEQGRF